MLVTDHLKRVGSISGLEALNLYRVMDLPKLMSDLINKGGLPIRKQYRNDNTGVRYLRYHFDGEDVREQVGKEVYSGDLFQMN
jgi:hypothetical protein